MENTQIVFDAMKKAAKPLKAGEVAELAGLEKKATEAAMEILKKEGAIVSPKRCFWEAK